MSTSDRYSTLQEVSKLLQGVTTDYNETYKANVSMNRQIASNMKGYRAVPSGSAQVAIISPESNAQVLAQSQPYSSVRKVSYAVPSDFTKTLANLKGSYEDTYNKNVSMNKAIANTKRWENGGYR